MAMTVVALIKALILVVNGPSGTTDSPVYVGFADAILDHGRAFAPVTWGAEAAPPFIFRPPGYPLFLAATKLIAADDFAYLAVVLQGAVGLIAMYLMFRVASRLLQSTPAALIAVLLYAGSTSVLWDNSILSDSLFASLWNIVVFALLGHLVGVWRLKLHHYGGLGVLWGYSLWLRDVGIYFTVLPVALILLIAMRERARSWMFAARLGVFLLLSASFVGAIVWLNVHRTGEAFFSITGMENWWWPGFDMARFGYARPFTGDDLVSTVVRQTMPDMDPVNYPLFFAEFHDRCGCTPTQMQAIAFATYSSTITRYPVAYARVVLKNFNYFALGELIADPLATVNQFLEIGAAKPDWRLPGLSLRNLTPLRAHFSFGRLVAMLLKALSSVLSAVLFTAYLLGTPYLLVKSLRQRDGATGEWIARAFLWVSFAGVAAALSLVHFEARYALPVFPAAALGIVHVVHRALGRYRGSAIEPGV